MTIGIGTICDREKKVIMFADRMWTNSYLSVEYEYPESKIEKLSSTCYAIVAGTVVLPTELFDKVKEEIDKKGIRNIPEIANKVKEEYAKERKKRIDDDVFKPRGMTIDSFYKEGQQQTLHPDLVKFLDASVEKYKFDLEILIGGVDKRAHLYVVFPPGRVESFDRVGYMSIGSGLPHAENTFILNNYTPAFSLSKALHIVYEAKKVAERAPGVGKVTDGLIIAEDGGKEIPPEIKSELEKVHNSKITQATNSDIMQLEEMINKCYGRV